ncbi:hypothetical protein, partial [Mycolicibacterium elephantis]|uniref:hypothetical protein n=1 Tax=Mycolicibacterium elephantis TaxID=81858 RepID=UPI0021F35183
NRREVQLSLAGQALSLIYTPPNTNRREVQLSLAGQALSLIYTPPNTSFREKSGLGVVCR